MGVKYLNGYFVHNCSKMAIAKTTFAEYEGKTIVVDTSIYLYKFLIDGNFEEQMYLFLSLFKYYCIDAIFVFDGKPPPEKWPLLRQRYEDKKSAQNKYDELQEMLADMSGNQYDSTVAQLEELRKKMVKLRPEHLQFAKKMMDSFGFVHIDAPCEADMVCADFVIRGIAWACLSEDMDLFLLGCPRVLRNISLLGHTWTIYTTELVLKELNIKLKDLVEIVVLSGSDYTVNIKHKRNIRKLLDGYRASNLDMSAYDWHRQVHSEDFTEDYCLSNRDTFDKHCRLFEPAEIHELLDPVCESYEEKKKEAKINVPMIREIMKPYGFIFMI